MCLLLHETKPTNSKTYVHMYIYLSIIQKLVQSKACNKLCQFLRDCSKQGQATDMDWTLHTDV